MKVKFRCPQCSQSITVGPEAMGKRGKCPGCQEVIQVPTAEQFKKLAAEAKAKASRPAPAAPTPPPPEPDPSDDELAAPQDTLWDDYDLEDAAAVESGADPLGPPLAAPSKTKKKRPKRDRTWKGFGSMLLGIVLMLATPVVVVTCWHRASQMSASNSWPATEGRVISSYVDESGFGRKRKYRARVEYSYSVNGRAYRGDQVSFGSVTGNSYSAQQRVADRYPPGKRADIYYDPGSPDQCVLEPGGWPILMAIPPIICGGLGWVFFASAAWGWGLGQKQETSS